METRPVRVLGIGGSMRVGSMSLVLLESALQLAAEAGAETHLADVRALNLPMYNSDVPLDAYPVDAPGTTNLEGPTSLQAFLAAVRAADAVLLCSPTYHGTISGAVKNALDCLEFMGGDTPRYLGGRVAGLIGMGGAGAMNALNAAYHTMRTLNALVVPAMAVVPKSALDTEILTITGPARRGRVAVMVGELVEFAATDPRSSAGITAQATARQQGGQTANRVSVRPQRLCAV